METEFRILGPLEVVVGGQSVPLGGRKQRTLLAVLLAKAGHAVSADELIDQVWGADAPPTVRAGLHVYLSRLRRLLNQAGDGSLLRRADGYTLKLPPGSVDAERFERLARLGREALSAGDPAEASRAFGAGLALWRGSAFADLADEPAVAPEARRLEEARVRALEDRIEADLRIGRAADVAAELETLVTGQPYRERLHGQLMLALYQCGRQADALAAYRRFDRLLRDELGLEPGTDLKALHRRMLEHDTELERPRTEASSESLVSRPPRRRSPMRGRVVAGVAAVAAIGAAAGVGVAISRHGTSAQAQVSPLPANAVAALDPDDLRTRFAVRLGGRPAGLAVGRDEAWIGSPDSDTLVRLDLRSRTLRRFGIGVAPGAIAVGAGNVWIVDEGQRRLVQLDIDSPSVARDIAVPVFEGLDPIRGVTVAARAAWYAQSTTPVVHRVGPIRNAPTKTVRLAAPDSYVDEAGRGAIGSDGESVWASYELVTGYAVGAGGGEPVAYVARIDPGKAKVVARTRLPGTPTAIAVDENAVWIAVQDDDRVWRLDARTGTPEREVAVAGGPIAIAVGQGAVWVLTARTNDLLRIDPETAEVTQRADLGARPVAVTTGAGLVWVAVAGRGSPD